MPTSSQALILINADGITPQEFGSSLATDNRPCPVSKISLHGEQLSYQTLSPREEVVASSNSRYSTSPRFERVSCPTSPVKGYRGVFAFDPVTRAFSWQLLTDTGRICNVPSSTKRFSPRFYKTRTSSVVNVTSEEAQLPLGRIPDPIAFENNIKRLMDLGFRHESNKKSENWFQTDQLNNQRQQPISSTYKKPSGKKKLSEGSSILPSRLSSAPVISTNSQQYDISKTTITRLPRRMDSFVLNYKSVSTPHVCKTEERALYEEIKRQDAKKKKKKYVPTIRMRRELPPLNSNMLCFNFYDGNLSHKDVKRLIEGQSDTQILDLKFDPIYVHLGEASSQYKCMWVFSVSNITARANLLYYGLRFNNERIKVRPYDDVMREEHNAFKLYKEVQDEQVAKQLKPNSLKKSQHPVSCIPISCLSSDLQLPMKDQPDTREVKSKKSKTRRLHREKN